MILTHHFFRLVLALASSHPAKDHAIPSPTIARTAQSMTMLMNHLMIVASICWNPARPGFTSHSYLRFSTETDVAHVLPSDAVAHWHLQSAPGTISVTITLVGVAAAAYTLPLRETQDMTIRMRERSIFFIILEVERCEIREKTKCSNKDKGRNEGIDEDIFSFFDTFLVAS